MGATIAEVLFLHFLLASSLPFCRTSLQLRPLPFVYDARTSNANGSNLHDSVAVRIIKLSVIVVALSVDAETVFLCHNELHVHVLLLKYC